MSVTSDLITLAPGAEDAEPFIQIPVGLPCLERGRLVKNECKFVSPFIYISYMSNAPKVTFCQIKTTLRLSLCL